MKYTAGLMNFDCATVSVRSVSVPCAEKLATIGLSIVTRSGTEPVAMARISSVTICTPGTSRGSIRYSLCDALNAFMPG